MQKRKLTRQEIVETLADAFVEGSEQGCYPESDSSEMQKAIACFMCDCLVRAKLLSDKESDLFLRELELDDMD